MYIGVYQNNQITKLAALGDQNLSWYIVNNLPTSNIDPNGRYLVPMYKNSDIDKYFEYQYLSGRWMLISCGEYDIASLNNVGLVKPDGETTHIKTDGSMYIQTMSINDIENIYSTEEK